jgi:hypothetical protein
MTARETLTEAQRLVDELRYTPPEDYTAEDRSRLGSVSDYLGEVLAGPLPEDVAPAPQLVLPVELGGVFGQTKWLPGSLGCDIFLARHTPVLAPMDCTVRRIVGGTGLQGGAEVIIATLDFAWAWRYRHVLAAAGLRVGTQLQAGDMVARINDASLDQLGRVPPWAGQMPDGWQHLDLSVNRGSDQFAPTGGGGGNVDADEWLVAHGYEGRMLARTPGPPDGGMRYAEAIVRMMPAEYHWVP